MRAHLQRHGIPVARRTVEQIMRHRRGPRAPRSRVPTECDPAAARTPDPAGGEWRVVAPDLLAVADLTYIRSIPVGSATMFFAECLGRADTGSGVLNAQPTGVEGG